MDKDGFRKSEPGSLLIIAENSIEDSSTTPRELNSYTAEIGGFFERESLFPDFPEETIPTSGHSKGRRAWYGRSSFYFGFTLDQDGFQTWLSQDPTRILSFAKKNKLVLQEEDFPKMRTAVETGNADDLHSILQRLLSNRNRTRELMDLFKLHIPKDTMEQFLVAQNPAFGNIQQRGHRITPLETAFRETDSAPTPGIDGFKSVQDPDARILNLECTPLPDGTLHLRFELSDAPRFLFFSLTPLSERRQRSAIELVFFDREGRFHPGRNDLILDPKSEDPLIHRLTSKWGEKDSPMALTLGFSRKDKSWGYGSSCQFRLDTSGITKEKLKH
jgi:hypothetical protein